VLVALDARREGIVVGAGRLAGFLLFWPGTNAGFLDPERQAPRPAWHEAAVAALCLLLGALLQRWAAAGGVPFAGGIAVLGIGLFWFFGVFAVFSLAWRWAGVDAAPLFRMPVLSRTIGDFWGRRWNMGFRDLFWRLVFRPWSRRFGPARAEFAVFFLSGLAHEFAFSLPAGGGYGLCLAYFLIQYAGKRMARRRPALRSWWWAAVLTIAPLPLLFHPPFVQNVVLPSLR